jgi:hypothetical protein
MIRNDAQVLRPTELCRHLVQGSRSAITIWALRTCLIFLEIFFKVRLMCSNDIYYYRNLYEFWWAMNAPNPAESPPFNTHFIGLHKSQKNVCGLVNIYSTIYDACNRIYACRVMRNLKFVVPQASAPQDNEKWMKQICCNGFEDVYNAENVSQVPVVLS